MPAPGSARRAPVDAFEAAASQTTIRRVIEACDWLDLWRRKRSRGVGTEG
jgi:hypothetical protein